MDEARVLSVQEVPQKHKNDHEGYEYFRRLLVGRGWGTGNSTVAQYEIPPGKSPYPYHYHISNEESFYILSGRALLRTPQGERQVGAGDFLHFPPGEGGAHKLTNISETETLVYLDFDVEYGLEVAIYPDSGKIGIWGKDINKLYRQEQDVDYYEGE